MVTMQAGASQVDITPPPGTLINGDFITHYACYIHDRMYAKALVLQQACVSVAICIIDICAMRRPLLDAVKKEIENQTGIPLGRVLISSTHTHAAGSVESLLLGAADLDYRQRLPALIVQAVVQAQQNLRPARIGSGCVDAPEYVLCRRYFMREGYTALNPVTGKPDVVKTNPFGAEDQILQPASGVDPQLCYLAIKDERDEWLCVLANYSMHYVGDWPNGTISPDYFGAFSRNIQYKLGAPAHFIGMLSNGTSGEANIWDFRNPSRFPTASFEKSNLIGEALAEKIMQSLHSIHWQVNPQLSVQYEDVSIRLRKPDEATLATAKERVAQSNYERLEGLDFATMQTLYARELVLLHAYPDNIPFPVQAIRIGNIIIGALGGEFFATTGLQLKRAHPGHHYFTITMANDYVGYVCPAHEIERGGYETWLCRTSCLDAGAEESIRGRLGGLIKEL